MEIMRQWIRKGQNLAQFSTKKAFPEMTATTQQTSPSLNHARAHTKESTVLNINKTALKICK